MDARVSTETFPPLVDWDDCPVGTVEEQIAEDGVIVLVTVPAPEYPREIEEAVAEQTMPITSLEISDTSLFKLGELTAIEEPEASVTLKLSVLTTID